MNSSATRTGNSKAISSLRFTLNRSSSFCQNNIFKKKVIIYSRYARSCVVFVRIGTHGLDGSRCLIGSLTYLPLIRDPQTLQANQGGAAEGKCWGLTLFFVFFTHVDQELGLALLQIAADFGGQEDTGAGAQLAILLVEFALKRELLKVDESHGHGRFLVAALVLGQLLYLPFQAAAK